jgi:glycyl-tRNA synthetase beta chain
MIEATLLVELLTEELPPKSLRKLAGSFSEGVLLALGEAGLVTADSTGNFFATPRRLATRITRVLEGAPNRESELTGPSTKAPEPAVTGFAKKAGVPVTALERRSTPKGEFYVARASVKGARLRDVLPTIVERALKSLPIPKMMRWGSADAQFVRPVHAVVMLHGERVIPGTILGITADRKTAGHRFMGPASITLKDADEYEKRLATEGMVMVDFTARRHEIERQLQESAIREGGILGKHDDLLDEVTALVEHPTVYAGKFDPIYLDVPQECLILTMRQNQKYFPLFDAVGRLQPKFLIVSNMRVADPRNIIEGNERVVRPRLEDARFFFNQDRKIPLRDRLETLKSVVYYKTLGTQYDRTIRIKSLATRIANALEGNVVAVAKAAELSKADLVTSMVSEFPELQGVMGRYYALNDKESIEVGEAIEQHYRPRFAADTIPENLTSSILALADKLELIAGMFGVGQEPTGDKDPFAVRRNALGVVRILVENKLELGLQSLVDMAISEMPSAAQADWLKVVEFVLDRARTYFVEKGFAAPAIEAVLQPFGANSPLYVLLDSVAEASRILGTTEGRILAEANKRITNILKKSGFPVPVGLRPDQLIEKPNPELFREEEEAAFWDALQTIGEKSLELRRQQRYAESLGVLSELAVPTKSFFDKVMVNAKEPEIQGNRITLVQHARAYMNQVADLSLMAS